MNLKRIWLTSTFIAFLTVPAFADEPDKQTIQNDFNFAYEQFQLSIQHKDTYSASAYAAKALMLGKQLYGEEHKNIAVLTYNYANTFMLHQQTLAPHKRNHDKTKLLFEQVIEIYEKVYDEYALEFIKPLRNLAHVNIKYYNKDRLALGYFKRALKITEENIKSSPLAHADLSLEIGRELLQIPREYKKAIKHLQSAYDSYHTLLPDNDERRAFSEFWLAKNYFVKRDFDKAEPLFINAISSFNKAGLNKEEIFLTTKAYLVQTYEKMGKSEKATQYCQEIGRAQPWVEDKDSVPIYMQNPKWPKEAVLNKQTGTVKVGFTITKDGFGKDFRVVKSKGSNAFKATTIKAMKKWRFAPKFVDGKAVDSDAKFTMIYKW